MRANGVDALPAAQMPLSLLTMDLLLHGEQGEVSAI